MIQLSVGHFVSLRLYFNTQKYKLHKRSRRIYLISRKELSR
jgi:hypothetical protein